MPPARRPPVRLRSCILAFGSIAAFLTLAHGPLLRMPFYWDEMGQFVPAALDLLQRGAWIPVSTVPNVHPPGVMAWLAAFWSVFGYSIAATRVAMLLIAAVSALFTFLLAIELARGSTGTPAFAALAILFVSPLFFAQSMLAQLDMPAMCFSLLALLLFLQGRFRASAIACAILVLVKETGAIVPALFGCWLLFERAAQRERAQSLWFLLPLPGLLIWLAMLHHATGYWFGNAAFAAYNLDEPLRPVRILLALSRRLYYLFIASGHFVGTIALIWALRRMPLLRDRPWRIAASFVLAHVLVVSLLGGAVLERYLLPALPVVYIAFAISLRALRPRARQLTFAGLVACLVGANFTNPVYPFPFENNLAYVSFVSLGERAAAAVERRGAGLVAATFPMADALRNPAFGYVQSGRSVIEVADFSPAEVEKLKIVAPDMIVISQRTWDPLGFLASPTVRNFLARNYGYKPELSPDQIAAALSMRLAASWKSRGLTMDLLTAGTISHTLLE